MAIPPPRAYMSIAKVNYEAEGEQLDSLRQCLQKEVIALGVEDFEILKDVDVAGLGENVEKAVQQNLNTFRFLLPVITPGFFIDENCLRDLKLFRQLENDLGRHDLIIPVYYIDYDRVDKLDQEVVDFLAKRGKIDWRTIREEGLQVEDRETIKLLRNIAQEIDIAIKRTSQPISEGNEPTSSDSENITPVTINSPSDNSEDHSLAQEYTEKEIKKKLIDFFSLSDINELCFDMNIDYESLRGSGKAEKAMALINYCKNHGRFSELVNELKKARPHVFGSSQQPGGASHVSGGAPHAPGSGQNEPASPQPGGTSPSGDTSPATTNPQSFPDQGQTAPPSEPQELSPGYILEEGYEILQKLGQGDMGVVYEARKTQGKKGKFAIKQFLPNDRTKSLINQQEGSLEDFEAAFQTEASLLKSKGLSHHNLVQFYEDFKNDKGMFFVMNFIQGQTLDNLKPKKRGFRRENINKWMNQLMDGVKVLHQHGIIHLDIQPSNLKINEHNNIILIDFGLATDQLKDQSIGRITRKDSRYASPELLEGDPIDKRSDIYSIGATLEFLSSKEQTEDGSTGKKIDPGLMTIITKSKQIYPEKRYQNVEEMITEFNNAAKHSAGIRLLRPHGALFWGFVVATASFLWFMQETDNESWYSFYVSIFGAITGIWGFIWFTYEMKETYSIPQWHWPAAIPNIVFAILFAMITFLLGKPALMALMESEVTQPATQAQSATAATQTSEAGQTQTASAETSIAETQASNQTAEAATQTFQAGKRRLPKLQPPSPQRPQ